ncbi:hypothetical protein [Mesorhizobium sp. ES1-4]|uniref:hypothetical protein n=1 Tax=Mesorhizobium sp. ES1-4 TaxID=2876627 RepID=UPI001CCEEBFA|nr:hypothetical protein [Mesorhizobium sp. ES1-4]MBZ9795860.1 hypothetical protein [Mesorhizobium sp. ES1-4]
MQMPQMAKNVFMGGFIALTSVAVKSLIPGKTSRKLANTSPDHAASANETFY